MGNNVKLDSLLAFTYEHIVNRWLHLLRRSHLRYCEVAEDPQSWDKYGSVPDTCAVQNIRTCCHGPPLEEAIKESLEILKVN